MIGTNYLLVIAIDKYSGDLFPKLNNAKLDAERLANILTKNYSFQLIQDALFDEKANRKNIIEALNFLQSSLTENDNLVIYFAGHGAINPKTKKGYWIPSDASKSIGDYIPNSTIIDAIEGIEAKHILLISDSCFAGAFLTSTRAIVENHYSKLAEQKSRWLFASGREEMVSDGQPGIGSPFALYLNGFLENNTSALFSLSELAVAVSKDVGNSSKQQPVFAHIEGVGHKGGQIIFKLKTTELVKEKLEIDSDLTRIVIPYKYAQKLKDIGVPQKSIFGYYSSKEEIILKINDGSSNFLCSAFILDEVAEFIPEHIEVDENTYVARINGYDKLNIPEIENLFAEVTFQRTGESETPFMSICRCKGRMVAFSKSTNGSYNNLICWGVNQAETAALMLLELHKESKVNFYNF